MAAFKQKTMVMKWKDKQDVTMLSTIHDDSMVNVQSRRGAAVSKPKVVHNYNSNMGGLDLSDNLLTHCTARNRVKKFYMKMFRHFLDISVLNAFIIYKRSEGQKCRLDFITLAENIISKYQPLVQGPSSSGGRPSCLVEKPLRLIGRHFPARCLPTEKKQRPQRKCAQCQKDKKEQY